MPDQPNPFPQFGVNLRAARDAAGLGQEKLARLLDVSLGTVWQWEHGVRLPRGWNFRALCEALDRPAAWFFEVHSEDEVAA